MDEQEKILEQEDERIVQEAFQHLLDTYLKSHHRKKVDLITKAFNFARRAHAGVRRLSGEPYIMHPIAVAQIVSEEIGLGSTSICSALLHDVVEDTDYTTEDIENIFGPKIAQIVDGLTKISGGIFGDKTSAQVENFKKLLLTMSDDIRVILIKIADRLHNMRTLGSQPAHKQYKIAGETLNIYAPLAYRLGLNKIKEELEDLSFSYEHPEECALIRQRLDEIDSNLKSIYTDFIAPMRAELDRHNIDYTIKARIKRPYSIWKKMQMKHVSFEDVYDILAVRIIFRPKNIDDEVAECLQIYGYITKGYTPHPERFRDWLNHPKANGYKALHTTLMSHVGKWIEVQIRSERMDEIAEQGFAAHWKYKDGEKTSEESESELDKWLLTIKEILDDPQPSGMDFLDTIKLNLYSNELFVLTPKGEVRKMPAGSTALDFAFTVHTFVGTHCIGAKVNHSLVPLNYVLRGGDQVEILTSKESQVRREWLKFTTTAKAQNKIQALLRREDRERQREGERILTEFLQQADMEPSSLLADKLCALHQLSTREELYIAIGRGMINLGPEDLASLREQKGKRKWSKYIPFLKRNKNTPATKEVEEEPRKVDRKKPLTIDEENIGKCILCPQCHPIPGDIVLGHIDKRGKVTIHKRNCVEADRLKTSDGNHLLAVNWNMHKRLLFPAMVHVEGIDAVGVLLSIATVLSQQRNVNMPSLNIQTHDGIFEGEINLEVHDVEELRSICRDLKSIDHIKSCSRSS